MGFMPLNEMITMKLDHSIGGSILTDLPNFISFLERKSNPLAAIGFRKIPLIQCPSNITSSLSAEDIAISKNQKDEEEMIPPPRLGVKINSPSKKRLEDTHVGIDTKTKGSLLNIDSILTAVQNVFIILDDNIRHKLGNGGRRNEDGEGYTIGDGAVFLRKISYASGKDVTFDVEEGSKSTDATYTIAEVVKDVGSIMSYVDTDLSEILKPITCNDSDSIVEKLSIHTVDRVGYRMSLALEGIVSEYVSRH
jgi:hypothetical protein